MGKPDFTEEKRLWRKGYKVVIGVDEVGRGAFAGPVVAAAVAFGAEVGQQFFLSCNCGRGKCRAQNCLTSPRLVNINDSKILRPNQRKKAAVWIKEFCSAYGIGEVGVSTINRVGIGRATTMAMRKALREALRPRAQGRVAQDFDGELSRTGKLAKGKTFVLVDAFHIKYLKGIGLKNQKAIKKGDQLSISIAAASILAKVYRDSLMRKITKRYRKYHWGRNKGYGTRAHQRAIIENGTSPLHRKKFVETFLEKYGTMSQ